MMSKNMNMFVIPPAKQGRLNPEILNFSQYFDFAHNEDLNSIRIPVLCYWRIRTMHQLYREAGNHEVLLG